MSKVTIRQLFNRCRVHRFHFTASIKSKMRKFINYLKESWIELTKKVTWPTWSKLQNSAVLVLVSTFILAAVVFVMDFAFQKLMEFIYAL